MEVEQEWQVSCRDTWSPTSSPVTTKDNHPCINHKGKWLGSIFRLNIFNKTEHLQNDLKRMKQEYEHSSYSKTGLEGHLMFNYMF